MKKMVKTRYGVMECLESDSVVSRSLELYGEWAQDELTLLQRLIAPGDVVLDVGAFIGTHTLAFAEMVGPTGVVHSFEPREAMRELLEGNVVRNGLKQVQVHGVALGAESGSVVIPAVDTGDAKNFGGLAIEAAAADTAKLTETILLESLDSLALLRVDLLKVDAEGMEADVLKGGRATILRLRPLIFAECNNIHEGSRTWLSMVDMGYRVYGAISNAFNKSNFRGEEENIFGEAAEVSLLAVPAPVESAFAQVLELMGLPEIRSLDDLTLLLLHKPQYPEEAWSSSTAANILGIKFSTPLSRELQHGAEASRHELEVLRRELGRVRSLHEDTLAKKDRLDLLIKELQVERDQARLAYEALEGVVHAMRTSIAGLERYKRSSLLYLFGRLRRRLK